MNNSPDDQVSTKLGEDSAHRRAAVRRRLTLTLEGTWCSRSQLTTVACGSSVTRRTPQHIAKESTSKTVFGISLPRTDRRSVQDSTRRTSAADSQLSQPVTCSSRGKGHRSNHSSPRCAPLKGRSSQLLNRSEKCWPSTMAGGNVPSNNALERTNVHRGRAVLAIDCLLGGAEWAPCQAAQLGRWAS